VDLARLRPNTFASVTTALSREALWEVVSNPLLLPELSSELQSVRLISSEPLALGSRFEGDQLRGERRWTTVSTITGFEPFQFFEWTVGDLAIPVSTWSFLLDANTAGTTVTHTVTLCGGPSPLTDFIALHPLDAERLVQERLDSLRERMAATVAGLVELAGSLVEAKVVPEHHSHFGAHDSARD
jgi:hypothetical protein